MDNSYIPKVIRIERVCKETADIKSVFLKYPLSFIPGQFLEISCFGIGEVPISISSSPAEELVRLTFRRVGAVTEALFNLKKNDSLGLRGPFGNGFSFEQLQGKDLIFIAGGMGIAPLRSLLKTILSKKDNKFGNITLLYGSRNSREMLYKNDLKNWSKSIKALLTVDKPEAGWKGNVGVVTQLLNQIKINPPATKAILCGPEIMMHFAALKLTELGMKPSDIIVSLERHMKCGVGKCGHCYIADKFVCRDGPVFTCEELKGLSPKENL